MDIDMLEKIKKIPDALRSARLWIKVFDLMSEHRDEEALELIKEIGDIVELSTEMKLMKCTLLELNHNMEDALELGNKITEYIDDKNPYSKDLNLYIKIHAMFTVFRASKALSGDMELELEKKLIDYSREINLKKVPKRWRRTFRLPRHPDWVEP